MGRTTDLLRSAGGRQDVRREAPAYDRELDGLVSAR